MKCIASLAGLLLLLSSTSSVMAWGAAGHEFITERSYDGLPAPLAGYFRTNFTTITDYARNEPPGNHFIDIDAYPEFLAGNMIHEHAALVARYGASTVYLRGESPWTITAYRQTLTQQMAAARTEAAWTALGQTMGEMSHYIEDIHQPLHCTRNYDGQYTGNGGVHARYETTMVGQHFAGLSIVPPSGRYIADELEAVFASIDVTYPRVADIMAADTYARSVSGGSTSSSAYYNALWSRTGAFTQVQFQDSAQMIADTVYSAWVDAGSPPPLPLTPEPGIALTVLAAGATLAHRRRGTR